MDTKTKKRLQQLVDEYNSTPCKCGKQHQITITPYAVGEGYNINYSPNICEKGLEELKAKIGQFEAEPILNFIKVIK